MNFCCTLNKVVSQSFFFDLCKNAHIKNVYLLGGVIVHEHWKFEDATFMQGLMLHMCTSVCLQQLCIAEQFFSDAF